MASTLSKDLKPSAARKHRVLRPRRGLIPIDFEELWRYRELLFFLTWRDILVRYKQTLLGICWAVLQPVLMMVVLTFVFGKMGKFPSEGKPYAVMTLAALLPWQFFSNALTQSSNSVVSAGNMIRKVYFPRLYIPMSAILSGVVDFLIAIGILFALMIYFDVPFRPHLLMLPAFFLVALLASFGVGLWFGALNVKYRDVRHIVPFLVRVGTYLSPVGFQSRIVLDNFGPTAHFIYSLNPMVGVIDGFRWAVLGPEFEPYWPAFLASMAMVLVLTISGIYYFRAFERTFADVI